MYILEGNIGAGKSTFLKLVEQHLPHVSIALEPIHNWQAKVYGQSLLANFYDKPKRWAYTLETFAMICRVREHLKEQNAKNPNRIVERSIYSGHYVFSQNGYEHGYMSDLEWQMYNNWFDFLISNKCKHPLGFIYLRVEPDIAYQRIKKRNRIAEKNITFSYLRQIHTHHERFLINKEGVSNELKKIPVLTIDCNQEFEADENVLKNHLDALQNFLLETQRGLL